MSSNGYAKISVKRGLKCSNPHETQSTCIFSFSTLPVPTVEKIQIMVLGPFINKILPILTLLLLHRHLANPSPVFLGIFLQGVSSQTGKSNLVLREGRKDISDILWHFFSRKFRPILISRLVFRKKKW